MADRIAKEIYSLENSEKVPVKRVEKIDNYNWKIIFEGPETTPFEDGIFTLKLVFPMNYPTNGPKAYFLTPNMFHPNITEDNTQYVCINILDDDKWIETRTAEDIMLGIIYLMMFPTHINGYHNSAYNLLKDKKLDEYYDKVEELTYKYANKAY